MRLSALRKKKGEVFAVRTKNDNRTNTQKRRERESMVTKWFKLLLPFEDFKGDSRLLEQDGQRQTSKTSTGDQHSGLAVVCGVVVNEFAHNKVGRVVNTMEVLVLLVVCDGHVL